MHLNDTLNLNGLGLGSGRALMSNYEIEDGLEKLVRSAALKTVREMKTGLSGIETANSEREFDKAIENSITQNTLEGLAMGDLEPISDNEFKSELMKELYSSEMSGFFSSFKRAIKKVIKSPITILKKTIKVVKKVVKKVTPILKKVVPLAAGAAALYFTGGAAAPFLSKIGGGSMDIIGKVMGSVFGGGGAPPEQPVQYVDEVITQAPQNPQMIDGGVMAVQQLMKQRGINMQSPQAKAYLQQVIKGQYVKMKQKVIPMVRQVQRRQGLPPVPEKKSNLPLLAAGGAGLLFLMMG